MGTGKSTVGRLLAQELGLAFLDLDVHLVERFGPIAAQFSTEGEAVFRQREAEAIAQVCVEPALVLATGGGAWMSATNRMLLAQWGDRVVLGASIDTLRQRVGDGVDRPNWDEHVEGRWTRRQAAYADADLFVVTDALSPEHVVRNILQWRVTR
jgi:shikimate kinase